MSEDRRLWKVFTTCIGKKKAKEMVDELEDKTGYSFVTQDTGEEV